MVSLSWTTTMTQCWMPMPQGAQVPASRTAFSSSSPDLLRLVAADAPAGLQYAQCLIHTSLVLSFYNDRVSRMRACDIPPRRLLPKYPVHQRSADVHGPEARTAGGLRRLRRGGPEKAPRKRLNGAPPAPRAAFPWGKAPFSVHYSNIHSTVRHFFLTVFRDLTDDRRRRICYTDARIFPSARRAARDKRSDPCPSLCLPAPPISPIP